MKEETKNYYSPREREKIDYSKVVDDNAPNFTMKFTLTKLFGAKVIEREDEDGNLVKGVFVPLRENDLKISPSGDVSVYCFVNKCFTTDKFDYWTHYIRLKADPSFVKKMNGLGYKMPYLGNLKSKNYVVYKNNYKKVAENYVDNDD